MPTADPKHLGNDPELVSSAQKGDEEAFVALYERHAPIAWRTSLAITGHPDEAAATMGESFARTFTAIRAGRVAPDATFRTLLLTSVRNTAIDRRRDQGADSTAPRFEYADGDDAVLVAAAFAPLPERWRTALWLTEVEGLRGKQIAPVVGLASPATLTLVGRAHSGLAEQYLQLHLGQVNDRTCSRSVARLGSYVAGTLPASDAEKLERHLQLCEDCSDRHTKLRDLGPRLRTLILPLPADLVDDVRAAWAAAVATPAGRTGTGLSPTAEKVLAGVSAFAAAVGVFGATMFGASSGGGDDERAAAIAPAAAESSDPENDDPLAGVTPVDLPSPSASSQSATPRDSFGSSARQGTGTTAGTNTGSGTDGVVGASGPGDTRTPVSGGEPTDPRTDGNTGGDDGNPEGSTSSEPAVKVDTTVADVPVVVDVGEDPGVTVGSASVGSEPEPEADADDSTLSVDGPLEPLAPVVEPVDEVVTGISKSLGL